MTRRWIMIAFAVSVALNLFFFGVAAARFSQRWQWRAQRRADPALAMPGGAPGRPEGRWGPRRGRVDPLSWLSNAEREQLRPERQALLGLRRDAEQVLTAEPFDAAKLRATLSALRTQTAQFQTTLHERLVQRAESLGVEERRKLAETSWGTPGERGRPPPRQHD